MSVHTTGSTPSNFLTSTVAMGGRISAESPVDVSIRTLPATGFDYDAEQIIIGVPGDFEALEPATAHAQVVDTLHDRTDFYYAQSVSGYNTQTGQPIHLATGVDTFNDTIPTWSAPGDFVFGYGAQQIWSTGYQPRD